MVTVIRVLGTARSFVHLLTADPSRWNDSRDGVSGGHSSPVDDSSTTLHPWSFSARPDLRPGFPWALTLPASQELGPLTLELAAVPVNPGADLYQVHWFLVGADLVGHQSSLQAAGTADEPGLRCLRLGTAMASDPHEARLTMAVRRRIANAAPIDLVATCTLVPQEIPSALVLIDRLLWGDALLHRIAAQGTISSPTCPPKR